MKITDTYCDNCGKQIMTWEKPEAYSLMDPNKDYCMECSK